MQYLILNVQLTTNFSDISLFLKSFAPSYAISEDKKVTFSLFSYDSIVSSCYGVQYLKNSFFRDGQHLFFSGSSGKGILLSVDKSWSNFGIYTKKTRGQWEVTRELMLVGFYSYMSLYQTLLLHASAIDCDGKSLVFTAPSGTGKTTQAELWMKYRGAKILNGDKVFLKQETDAIHAWGSPWTGSSPYGLNSSAPLEAIIILKQAKENSIRRLDTLEAMTEFVPNVFFPRWDERCEQAVLDFLDRVMSETKFYLLSCRPDEEAVEITEKAIFGDGLRKEG